MDAQESAIYIAIIVVITAFVIIGLLFFYAVVRQHKKVLHLERENARAQIELLEKDRARIAEDLHDDLAPMLAAVRMKVNSFDLIKPADVERLVTTNSTIDDIARRMRSISFDLMPSSLREKGLEKAILEFINNCSSGNAPNIRFVTSSERLELDEGQTIHLYRIIQEIIHNSIKHAKADELVILLKKEHPNLLLLSEDNGVGFDYKAKLQKGTGLGLRSVQNRVDILGGTLQVDSRPGKTNFTIQIPLKHE